MVSVPAKVRGRIIAVFGVLCSSPDALCVRYVSLAGADVFAILAWKFFFVFLLMGTFTTVLSGGVRPLLAGFFQAGWYVIPTILVQAVCNLTYTLALVNTSAANALLLVNLSVMWTALFGYLGLGERLQLHTKLALVSTVGAVAVISVPTALGGKSSQTGLGKNPLLGDGLALTSGMCWAAFITLVRYVGKRAPKAKMSAAGALGAGLCATICATVQGLDRLLPHANGFQGPSWEFFCVVGADAMCICGVVSAASLAPALIPGPEVAAILLLEVLISPLWIFLAFHVAPSFWTLVGGSILLSSLLAHELLPVLMVRSCRCRSRSSLEAPSLKKHVDAGVDSEVPCSATEHVDADVDSEVPCSATVVGLEEGQAVTDEFGEGELSGLGQVEIDKDDNLEEDNMVEDNIVGDDTVEGTPHPDPLRVSL